MSGIVAFLSSREKQGENGILENPFRERPKKQKR